MPIKKIIHECCLYKIIVETFFVCLDDSTIIEVVQSCLLAFKDHKVDNTKNSKVNTTSDMMSGDLENDKLVNLNDFKCRLYIFKL